MFIKIIYFFSKKIFIIGLFLFLYNSSSFSQSGACDNSVPIYYLDLTGAPDSIWTKPNILRDGSCCGYNHPPNSCVKFIVTLDSESQGITFNITDGALPQNLEWQLMNSTQDECNPNIYQAGEPVCLDGVGPHVIIFCKPGGNNNTYTITSIQAPSISDDLVLNDGCSGFIQALGYDIATVQYNSIYPGIFGAYNNILSCTSGCANAVITGQQGFPSYVDFQVCGMPFGSCFNTQICDTVRVYFYPTLIANINPINPTICYGSNTANISVNGTGGYPPYNYLWSTGDTTQTINIGVGTYSVTISDSTNCSTGTAIVNVTYNNSPVSVNAGSDQIVCTNNLPVQLNGTVSGASGGIWVGGNGTISPSPASLNISYSPSALEIANGGFSLNLITTGNGSCPADTDIVNISIFVFQSNLIDSTDISCYGAADGSVTAFANIGTPPLIYFWSDGSTSGINNGLSGGNYTVTVTDNAGCSDVLSVSLYEPTPIIASVSSTSTPCQAFLATAEVTPSGGVPGYTYQWNDPGFQTTQIATGLGAGYFIVTVTDNTNCSQFFGVAIANDGPPYVSIIDSVMVSCFNGNNGSATCEITTPGVLPHTYQWNDMLSQTTATAIGLTAGTYTVIVTDSINCIGSAQVTISEPSALTSITQSQNISCFGLTDGSASVSVSGGNPPYNFLWSNGQGFTNITGLGQGKYFVTITDFNNCTQIDSVNIFEPLAISSIAGNINNISCNGLTNGSATIIGNNGTLPYNYLWSTGQSTSSISNLSVGTYMVTVSDANGCSSVSNITISQPEILSISGNIVNVSCYGNTTGSIDITVSGGTSPFLYGWTNGAITEDLYFIGAGNYSVTINDANGCNSSQSFSVSQPNAITIYSDVNNISCFGASDGSVNVVVSGGTPSYSYLWNTGSTNSNIFNLQQGIYQLTVTDVNLCTATITKVINEPFPFIITITLPLNYNGYGVPCFGDTIAFINLSANGGTEPYSFAWSNNTNNIDLYNVGAGNYSVTVTDAQNCVAIADTEIIQPPPLIVSLTITDVLCYNGTSGSADVSISGGVPGYSVIWSTTSTVEDLLNIPAGSYWVQVRDLNICTFFDSIIINQPNELVLTCTPDTIICKNTQAIINAYCSGGILPYKFFWNNTPGISVFTITPPTDTTLNINVIDFNDCLSNVVASTVFTYPAVNLSVATTDDSVCLGNSVQIIATISGGYSNDYILTDMNQIITSPHTITPNITQDWIFMAKDSCNVKAYDTITIYALPSPMITGADITDVLCYEGSTGAINITVTGGTPGYQFIWNSTAITEDLINVQAGTYFIQVRDTNNCFASDSMIINEPEELNISGSFDTLTCKNLITTLQAVATGGVPPYSFFWNGMIGLSQFNVTPASDTTIYVYVKDVNNCISDSVSTSISIYPNVDLSVFTIIDTVCAGSLTQIFANAFGGAGPPYSLFNENMQSINIPYTVTPVNSQYWIITGMDRCHTKAVDSVFIQTIPLPDVTIRTNIVSGCIPLHVYFIGISEPESQSYNWNFGENNSFSFAHNPEYLYNEEGTYDVSLTVTSFEGCKKSLLLSNLITVHPEPDARFNFDPFSPSILNSLITFTNYSSPGTISYWSFGDGDSSGLSDPTHSYITPGIYDVNLEVQNIYGCKDVSNAKIRIHDEFTFYAPTAFSPDYNDINDNFSVYGFGIDPDKFTLYIYDRWGEMIFKTNTLLPGKDGGMYSEPWNGEVNNNSAISKVDSYKWLVQYNDIKGAFRTNAGVVVVIR